MRDILYAMAAATGLIGTGFHIYNVGKKTGGFCWQNLFYRAPLGAPMAILLSGLVGFCSERVRDSARGDHADDLRASGRPHHGGGDGRGASRHDRRGRADAFSRRVPQSVHDVAGHAAAGRCPAHGIGGGRAAGPQSLVHALVDASAWR